MKVISFINEKGGTCKTTFAVNFAAYMALKKKKNVLLVDLDSQGHAGKSLGLAVHDLDYDIFDVLTDSSLDPGDAVVETNIPRLHLLGSNKRLADFPETVAGQADRELLLQKALKKVSRRYDVAFIDSPPSVGLVTSNVLTASTDVVVPVALTYLALDGCAEVVRSIAQVRERHKSARTELKMVIPTLYRPTRLANEIVAKLAHHFPDRISKTILGFNVKLDEAQSFGQTIWEYDPNGKGAVMMAAMAEELYKRTLSR